MKSFLAVAALAITVSIACTGSKSAGSTTTPVPNTTATQPSAQIASPASQEKPPCTLKLTGAPTLNGFRLGMTRDEVLAVFPGSKEDAELRTDLAKPPSPLGVSSFLIKPEKYQSKDQFTGIGRIVFTFLDGRASSINFSYNGPEYSHVDKFVEKFLEGKNLPALDQWSAYTGLDNNMKVLKCADFEVNVYAGGSSGSLNYVLLKDLLADATLKDRRKKAREKASPTPAS